jgi:hypothetical protein
MLLLFQKDYEDDSFSISPIVASDYDWKIEDYLRDLLKDSTDYDDKAAEHADKCKNIIRYYLKDNYDAITGWRDVRSQVKTGYPISIEEKDKVINFLCNNYSYCYGRNIIESPYNQSFIPRYCDTNKLSKPYPRLPKPPERPKIYYRKEWFLIEEIKNLDE